MAFERGPEFVAAITAIEDMPQPWEPEAHSLEDIGSAVSVLDVGGMDEDEEQKAAGVGDVISFATFDFLACDVAGNAAAFSGFSRLAVEDARRWARFATDLLTRRHPQKVIDCCQQAAVSPGAKIAALCRDWRKASGQHPRRKAAAVVGVRKDQDRT